MPAVPELLESIGQLSTVTNYSVRICRTAEQRIQGQTHLLPKRNYRPFMAQWSSTHRYCRDQWCTVASNTSSCSLIAWENKLQSTNCQSIDCFEGLFFCQRLPYLSPFTLNQFGKLLQWRSNTPIEGILLRYTMDFVSFVFSVVNIKLPFAHLVLPINSSLRQISSLRRFIPLHEPKMKVRILSVSKIQHTIEPATLRANLQIITTTLTQRIHWYLFLSSCCTSEFLSWNS